MGFVIVSYCSNETCSSQTACMRRQNVPQENKRSINLVDNRRTQCLQNLLNYNSNSPDETKGDKQI
jgi:hypothetical protein